MPLPTLVAQAAAAALDAFCEKRVPPQFRDQIQLVHSARGNTITLTEVRPHWRMPGEFTRSDIAQFRFRPATGTWHLYWADRHNRWHLYESAPPTAYIRTLIAEVDRDPTGIFWG
jgi:hypothetical protein